MVSAIIVAAGKGTRMGPGIDKLFLEVAGRPVVSHTWRTFEQAAAIDEIVLVVREGMQPAFEELANQFGFKKPWQAVAGGKERQDSVWNGLEALASKAEIVVIQDGARPLTSQAVIEATIEAAREGGAAVAAQPVTDTIKESRDGLVIDRTLDRARLFSVQTPQTFRVWIIREAVAEARRQGLRLTDDTAACELVGHPVKLIVNLEPNPKVTRPEDLPYIEALLEKEKGGG